MRRARTIKALLAAIALAFLAYYVDPGAMARAAVGARPFWIAAAVLLMPLNVLLEGLVWHLLIRRVSPSTGLRDHVGALFAGYALGFFTPGRVGEFAGRAFYIRHHDRWEVAAVVAIQRLLDTAVGIAVGSIALILFIQRENPQPEGLWRGAVVAGLAVGMILLLSALRPAWAQRALGFLLPFPSVQKRLAFLSRLSPRAGLSILGLNLARYAVFSTQFVLLLLALTPGARAFDAYLGIALVFLVKFSLPSITLMDLGVREGAAVFFLGFMGYSSAAALNASLMLFSINLLIPAAIGLPMVMRLRIAAEEKSRT